MRMSTYRNAYRSAYHRSRRGPAYRAKQGAEGFIAGQVLAILIALAI